MTKEMKKKKPFSWFNFLFDLIFNAIVVGIFAKAFYVHDWGIWNRNHYRMNEIAIVPGWNTNDTIRSIRASPLMQQYNFHEFDEYKLSPYDKQFKFMKNLNNLHVARAVQINIRDYSNPELALGNYQHSIGPNHVNILWFRPIDHMPSNLKTNWDKESYANEFNPRIAASQFLPRCIRENLMVEKLLLL